jgi:preprotein translocase subunit SecA
MDSLREGIGLRGIGGKDPLIEYKIEGYAMFQEMMRGVREEVTGMTFKVQIVSSEDVPVSPMRNITYGAPSREAPRLPAGRQGPTARTTVKIGRNDPCPCGSGKKYKKCCLPREESKGLLKENAQ